MLPKKRTQIRLSNLSMGLIHEGLELLQRKALRVYKFNADKRGPPIAETESVPSGIAILLLMAGLDYHLASLKCRRDILPDPPLPHTPYFSWRMEDSLYAKLENLLVRRGQKTLKEQLIEITSVRDSVAHPKLFKVTQEYIGTESAFGRSTAILLPKGSQHRNKTLSRKMVQIEYTKLLRLPLVPDWISYKDAVLALIVVTRMMSWMERDYGNPYAWVGNFSVGNKPLGFFPTGNEAQTRSVSLVQWTSAFFDNLSASDQEVVKKRLKGNLNKYLEMPPMCFPRRRGKASSMLDDFKEPEPAFLTKPPPPKWSLQIGRSPKLHSVRLTDQIDHTCD